jgi:hypothetical protein
MSASVKCFSMFFLMGCICLFASDKDGKKVNNYPELTTPITVIEGVPGQWDENKPHTMSIVEANMDGYKYWAFYGLAYYGNYEPSVRKAGLARSNDLIHWEKYEGNPIIKGDCRWPTVVFKNSTFYMFYAEYNSECDSRIVMVTSKDGKNFDNKEVIVPMEKGKQNQNPFIFFNKQDETFYLAYYNGIERDTVPGNNVWNINILKSKNINELKNAKPKTLISSPQTLAAPSIAYYNNKYYMLVEFFATDKWDGKWVTLGYESDKPDGKYVEVNNNPPVLYDNDACAFQYVLDGELYITYSHCLDLPNWNWELRMVKAKK